MKKKYILYIVAFMLICLMPSAGLLFDGNEVSAENRDLAKKPILHNEKGWNESFLKDAGAYFEDHFAFRNELVTGNAWIMAKVFGVSTEDSVIAGSEDWLYYKDSLEDYQGAQQMTQRQLFNVAHTMAMVQDYAEGRGITFAFTIAPNKNSLYGENMPYYYKYFRDSDNNLSRLQPYLDEEQVNYVDLYEMLSDKESVQYHIRDSHWNNQGAAAAADALMNYMGKEHPSYVSRDFELRRDFEGDLETMLYPAAVEKEEEVYYNPQPEFQYVQDVKSNFEPKISTVSADRKGSLVMYRDSFGNALLPFMAEAYGKAYFSRGVPYQLSDLITCQADALVIERAERFLPDMAANAPVMPAPIVMSDELGKIEYLEQIPDLEVKEQGAFTKISGSIPEELLEARSRIYIRVNHLLHYEAFPVSRDDGKEGFELYVTTESLKAAENQFDMSII